MGKNEQKNSNLLMVRLSKYDKELTEYLEDKGNKSGELKSLAKKALTSDNRVKELTQDKLDLIAKLDDLTNEKAELQRTINQLVNEKNNLVEQKNAVVDKNLALSSALANEQGKIHYLENRSLMSRILNSKNYNILEK